MSPADELAQHLAAEGVGAFGANSGWAIGVSREPPKPDTAITLYDTGGLDPLALDIDLRQPTIQVRVRGRVYAEAFAKQEEIRDLLAGPTHRTIGEHHYVGIWLRGDFIGIGRDDNDRHLITANYHINRQPIGVQS